MSGPYITRTTGMVGTYRDGVADGIREGERRMLWAIAVGAEWDDMAVTGTRFRGRYEMCQAALFALKCRGDEDAERLLEREW